MEAGPYVVPSAGRRERAGHLLADQIVLDADEKHEAGKAGDRRPRDVRSA
jgi:hypothetical protein